MKGLIIWINKNPDSDESILDALGDEIRSRGGRVEVFHSQALMDLGMEENHRAKVAACAMLAGHGVVVIASGESSPGIKGNDYVALREITENDLKSEGSHHEFMRQLELSGLVPPPKYDVHPDEETEILKKLRDLGYLDEE